MEKIQAPKQSDFRFGYPATMCTELLSWCCRSKRTGRVPASGFSSFCSGVGRARQGCDFVIPNFVKILVDGLPVSLLSYWIKRFEFF
jgi:hypothetical protein